MSSLRPLATITLLAAVGVVLYMKINETEPVIPAGVGEWTAGPLEIGGASSDLTATSPQLDAPAFNSGAAASSVAGDEAPAWQAAPPALEGNAATDAPPTTEKSADSSPVARTAEVEATLPEMPPLPKSESVRQAEETSLIAASLPASSPSNHKPSDVSAAATALAANPSNSALHNQTTADLAPPPFEPPAANLTDATASGATTDPATADAPPVDANAITPTPSSAKSSMYASARIAVQGDLDRGELAQALLKLSEWYGDPSLTPEESQEVETLLSQLAGDVIYEGPPAHRLEPAHIVQTGETLESIAQQYDVPWQLLANINHLPNPQTLQPGQELKVVRGPFSALVELGKRKMTLMLDRRYAGKFSIELDPTASIEEGTWVVEQKLLTPAISSPYGQSGGEDRSLLLSNSSNPDGLPALVRGPGNADPASAPPPGRVMRLKAGDVNDLYDILSVGSRITVRR